MKLDCREKGLGWSKMGSRLDIAAQKEWIFFFVFSNNYKLMISLYDYYWNVFFNETFFVVVVKRFLFFFSVWVCKKDFVGGKNRQFFSF